MGAETDPVGRPSARRSRLGRVVAGLGFIIGVVLVSTGCLPPLLDPPTSGRVQGRGPLDSIREAARDFTEANASCGLSSTELAGMMMVPIAFESSDQSPSPMTLSRWDNVSVWSLNANLFAFGQTSGPYVNAFFSPGIGLWQFDSAGGWDLTAADAIDTVTAAGQAADTIGYRWCNAPTSRRATPQARRAYALGGPWYYCGLAGDTRCEDTYNSLVTADGKLNVGVDATVSRSGGMSQRTCNVYGLANGITCFYVNPALAEGSRSWTYGTYDPARPNHVTPLPKPFYVFRFNGNEYRMWIREDTGYDIGISAWHPVTSNARTSIQWASGAYLCDMTLARGVCTPPRVATGPSGATYTANPIGALDGVSVAGPARIAVSGWALDPDSNDSVQIHVYVDGAYLTQFPANTSRPDIAAAFAGYGEAHGYSTSLPLAPGAHQVCAYAINLAPYGDRNTAIGCRSVSVPGDPFGDFSWISPELGGARISGWALDPDQTGPVTIRFAVDGVAVGQTTASDPRADVAASYPDFGAQRGYATFVRMAGGSRSVCVTALNVGVGGDQSLGCRRVVVSGDARGGWAVAAPAAGGVLVQGWAFDPDTGDATLLATVDGGPLRTIVTDRARADVTRSFPTIAGDHGYSATIAATPGAHSICLTVVNQGAVGANLSLGCRSVNVWSGTPFGSLDSMTRIGDSVRVTGWAIDPDVSGPVQVSVVIAGTARSVIADTDRPDVGVVYRGYGSVHGFDSTLPVGGAPVTVCVSIVNQLAGSGNTPIACRTI